jgi:hypothetical protein
MKKTLSLLLICLMAIPLSKGFCQEADTTAAPEKYGIMDLWGIGIKGTTDGVGFEVIKGFGKRLNVRLGYSMLNIPFSYPVPDIMEGFTGTIDANFKFGGANLYLDFYPVKNVIHLTAGVIQNSMQHNILITPTSEFPYGDIMVPAADLGTMEAIITPGEKFSPYFALGFGNTLSRAHRVSFNFELGAFYMGSPHLELIGTHILGPLASQNNMQVLMTSVAQYVWYPMLSMQLSFRII